MHRARFVFNLSLLSDFVKFFNKFIFFLIEIVNLHNTVSHLFPYLSGNMNNFSESTLYEIVEIENEISYKVKKRNRFYTLLRNKSLTLPITTTLP